MPLLSDPLVMFYQSLVWLHVGVGTLALVLFWLPLLVKRGGRRHKRFGAWYIRAMYVICASGAIMSMLVLYSPQYFKPEIFSSASDIAAAETSVRRFWFFLLFLCVLVFSNIRQALFALNEKTGERAGRPWNAAVMPAVLLLFSLTLAVIAVSASHILFGVFALLGTANALAMLRYLSLPTVIKQQQIVEHIGNICGSGIGVYTAFFAFGGRTLFEGLGQWQLAFWIVPGIVGTMLISLATRPYRVDKHKPVRTAAQQ